MNKLIFPALSLLLLSGCAVGPDYQRPNVDMPDYWAANSVLSTNKDLKVQQNWWTEFNDPKLNKMVEVALANNQNLAAAIARVDQAAALAKISHTELLPGVNASAGYNRARTSQETTLPGYPLIGDTRQANALMSWELDLWGKLRRRYEGAKANFRASSFEYDAARLSIAAQVSHMYFQLRALDAELEVAQSTLKSREESLKLREIRFRGGLTSALDLHQAEAEAASARADVPRYRKSVEQTEHALSVLLGQSPRQMMSAPLRGENIQQMTLPPEIPAGLPSELLQRRADVAAAEQRLVAANAKIGEARAAYFPDISLTAAIGSQSTALDTLFSGPTRTWSFVGNLAAPIFNFGATGYAVDAAKAGQRQALAQYQSSIQQAFRETLDSLSALGGTAAQESALQQQLSATQKTVHLAQLRYDNGYSDYLDLLDAQRNEYQSQIAVISARQARLDAVVSLYQALGGGWDANKTRSK